MKAIRLLEYGGQLVFDDVPAPAIARDEILVKVGSTTVNHRSCEGLWSGKTDTPDRPAVDTWS